MAKRSWDKDRERRQMQNSEPAEPKNEYRKGTFVRPPADLPDWMHDKSLLPKKPPGR